MVSKICTLYMFIICIQNVYLLQYIYITHIYGLYFKSISNINTGGGKGDHTVSLIGIINSHVYKIQREMY